MEGMMFHKKPCQYQYVKQPTLLLVATITVFPWSGYSGPLNLAQDALEIAPGAEPNIVILFDDSGSMDWEATMASGVLVANQPDGKNIGSAGGITHQSGCSTPYYYGVQFKSNTYNRYWGWDRCAVASTNTWRFRNSQFNKLYYDPTKTYKPWPGVDKNGKVFGDIDVKNAPDNPYSPAEFIDLTRGDEILRSRWGSRDNNKEGFAYYIWNDDGDGIFENGEQKKVRVRNLSKKEQTNFANWFVYYRSRDLVAKGALGFVIEGLSNARVGFTSINTTANNFPVASLNASVLSGNKKKLLDKIYGTPIPANGTPLRRNLRDVGRYFECVSGNRFNASGSSCPIQPAPIGTCQQNYAMLMTDGYYNGGSPGVGNQDRDSTNNIFDGGAFADNQHNTLADVAMYYYKRDLSRLPNSVPITKYDKQRSLTLLSDEDSLHQHMATFTIGFGLKGTVATYPTDPKVAFNWPNPFASDFAKVDDLLHAAYNGRGEYLSAEDPERLVDGLQEIFRRIKSDSGAASAVAFNTQSIKANAFAFRALFNPKQNNGDVVAHPVDAKTGEVDTATVIWSATKKLDEKLAGNNVNNRNIITYRINNDGTKVGVPFNYDNNLSQAQRTNLDNPVPFALPTNYGDRDGKIGDERLSYLRGDQTHEGTNYDRGQFRERLSSLGRLGDIIHSTPTYVGPPIFSGRDSSPYPTSSPYSSFAKANKSRRLMLYVGANDGMLHGFNASTGEEVFAYVPNVLFSELYKLTSPDYVHQMYVDEKASVNDAFYGGAWHTILIGSLGAGGRGYFALDVTKPEEFDTEAGAATKVLWEFTASDDNDLGFTYSRPIITMTNATSGGEHLWLAIFGNGYNSTSTNGNGVLFLNKLTGHGADGNWDLDTDYYKIDTGKGKAASADGLTPNGIGLPRAVDLDGNGTVDYVYAGDLQGNLWRFDLTGGSVTSWDGTIIFTAKDNQGKPQPIVNQPIVVRNTGKGGVVVVIGTGTWITRDDIGSTDIQSMYGIWDDLSNDDYPVSKNDLVEQKFINTTEKISGFTTRILSDLPVEYSKDNDVRGWQLHFHAASATTSGVEFPGERAVRKLFLIGNSLLTTTVIPNPALACATLPGGFLIGLDPLTGGRSKTTPLFDLNNDGAFDEQDKLSNGTPVSGIRLAGIPTDPAFIGNRIVIQEHTGNVTSFGTNLEGLNTGRLSWRQLLQGQ
ncbi:pilus assembly protein [Spartinivicinus poritis]|uniref:PilC/PilY family type IV pilus protein n=1 Tax=Spartinivicinus poritis TaxID=2994640 RepID=A0ABT5U3D4_9GAMM|nr:PilC/PilY family type IV pilus protein [Spartinivicinus sp. A2-2]MDE1460885.1 PilC/PilY family type IV pilus protein [Spartinivicinus sp. A2-2]